MDRDMLEEQSQFGRDCSQRTVRLRKVCSQAKRRSIFQRTAMATQWTPIWSHRRDQAWILLRIWVVNDDIFIVIPSRDDGVKALKQ